MPNEERTLPEFQVYTREMVANVLVSSLFLSFAYSCTKEFVCTWRVSTLLIIIKESLDALFFLCRRIPKEVTWQPSAWVMSICGTTAPFFLLPIGNDSSAVGTWLQYAGGGLQILSICSLNRSFGLVPANRGIKRLGMYRFIRHPLYLSYNVALLGFVMNNYCIKNVAVFTAALILNVLRIMKEEEILSKDPDYQEYAVETRWKMIPYLF